MIRRRFLKMIAAGAAAPFLAGSAPFIVTPTARQTNKHVVILHTNDTHSRIDPFPMDGSTYQGLGGVARRAALINDIRSRNTNVVLLDSGDVFQGTPYFNFFKGEVDFKAMSAMRYDVATIGNHDFDNGVEGFVDMQPFANFEWVNANYDMAGSPMAPFVEHATVLEREGIRVGIFGLGIDFDQLVLPELHAGVGYKDPVPAAQHAVDQLRNDDCDLVICLSHLGYRYGADRPSDVSIANEVRGIDIILGGHTHTFMDAPETVRTPGSPATLIHQVGFAGIRLGRIDLFFDSDRRLQRWFAGSMPIDRTLEKAAKSVVSRGFGRTVPLESTFKS